MDAQSDFIALQKMLARQNMVLQNTLSVGNDFHVLVPTYQYTLQEAARMLTAWITAEQLNFVVNITDCTTVVYNDLYGTPQYTHVIYLVSSKGLV